LRPYRPRTPSRPRRRKSAATSWPTTRPSPCGRRPTCGVTARAGHEAEAGHEARALPAHPILPQALQVLLLPRVHGQERREIETYLSALSREIDLYADRDGLVGRQFEFVYFGGGTPSYLSNEQLKRLVERVNHRWRWDAAKEVTFECEPGTLKESKLRTIKEIGVTRLSLGVEHFDDEILSVNGRAHKSPEIVRAYQWAREVGFPQINIDLIAGMLGETEDKWRYAVEKAIALDPDSVTIYQMEVPYNTGIARDARDHGNVSAVAGWDQKRAWVDYAFKQFEPRVTPSAARTRW
jgi:oxygen-independent coproporphyrinogen-3 oxidase